MTARFVQAFPYQKDVLALPVADLDAASAWYAASFGMVEVERRDTPSPTVILERDGVRIGFSLTGEDPSQDGAAVLVAGVDALQAEFVAKGIATPESRVDEREGEKYKVFFVVAPDGLCFYFHEPI